MGRWDWWKFPGINSLLIFIFFLFFFSNVSFIHPPPPLLSHSKDNPLTTGPHPEFPLNTLKTLKYPQQPPHKKVQFLFPFAPQVLFGRCVESNESHATLLDRPRSDRLTGGVILRLCYRRSSSLTFLRPTIMDCRAMGETRYSLPFYTRTTTRHFVPVVICGRIRAFSSRKIPVLQTVRFRGV